MRSTCRPNDVVWCWSNRDLPSRTHRQTNIQHTNSLTIMMRLKLLLMVMMLMLMMIAWFAHHSFCTFMFFLLYLVLCNICTMYNHLRHSHKTKRRHVTRCNQEINCCCCCYLNIGACWIVTTLIIIIIKNVELIVPQLQYQFVTMINRKSGR